MVRVIACWHSGSQDTTLILIVLALRPSSVLMGASLVPIRCNRRAPEPRESGGRSARFHLRDGANRVPRSRCGQWRSLVAHCGHRAFVLYSQSEEPLAMDCPRRSALLLSLRGGRRIILAGISAWGWLSRSGESARILTVDQARRTHSRARSRPHSTCGRSLRYDDRRIGPDRRLRQSLSHLQRERRCSSS